MRTRAALREALLLAVVAALTTWVSLLTWQGFAVDYGAYLGPLLSVAGVIALSGALLRWGQLPGWAVVATQLVLVCVVLSLIMTGEILPIRDAWTDLGESFAAAFDSARSYASPITLAVPQITPILLVAGAGCLLLVDLVACTMRRVPIAGLVLLTVYCVPVSLLGEGLSWLNFAFVAIGFMAMMYLQESDAISRWGHQLGDAGADASGFGVSNGALRASAGTAGGVATMLAIVLPVFIPTLNLSLFDGGFGKGGDGKIEIQNPMADLNRDLRRGEDIALLEIETDQPHPTYLRISVLNRFSDNAWSPGDRKVPSDQLADGDLPSTEGRSPSVPIKSYDYSVSVRDSFDSTWLPTQFPISSIIAPGDWRFDDSTMDFIAGSDDLTTAGLDYTMTAEVPKLAPAQMALSMAQSSVSTTMLGTELTDLPPGLPDIVKELANQVTRDQPTRFQKAVALQTWFRETGGFTYDLSTKEGSSTDDLVAFLTDEPGGRTGYCEQFAASMAVMARTLGIPSRVAIGFLEPEAIGANRYVYSAHDLHSWPELYFPGSGWVRFEPTPGGRAAQVPSYTRVELPEAEPATTATTSTTEEARELPTSTADPSSNADDGNAGARDSGLPWRGILIGVALAGVAALVGVLPRLLRSRRRARRLAGAPEEIWQELRDSVIDLGMPWPRARSPRETAAHLIQYFGTPLSSGAGADDEADWYGAGDLRPRHGAGVSPRAEAALDRIVLTLEQLRYSRAGAAAPDLAGDAQLCLDALTGGRSPAARRRARWLPRSLSTSRRDRAAAVRVQTAATHAALGPGMVDHAG